MTGKSPALLSVELRFPRDRSGNQRRGSPVFQSQQNSGVLAIFRSPTDMLAFVSSHLKCHAVCLHMTPTQRQHLTDSE